MKIMIAGGAGFIGVALGNLLTQERHQVYVLTRQTPKHASQVHWDGKTTEGWGELMNEMDSVVNLTGFGLEHCDTDFWAVVGDADGNGTDYATVLQHTIMGSLSETGLVTYGSSTTTADGFTTAPTMSSRPSSIVLGWADGVAMGNPFTAQAASSSSQNQRGFYITALTESLKLWGMVSSGTSNNISGINIWEGATGPSGSAAGNGVIALMGAPSIPVVIGMSLVTSYTLPKATVLRIVFTYSASATTPNRQQIGTGADATLKAAMLGGGGIYWAEANGTTNWANDNDAEFPAAILLVDDQVAVTGGLCG